MRQHSTPDRPATGAHPFPSVLRRRTPRRSDDGDRALPIRIAGHLELDSCRKPVRSPTFFRNPALTWALGRQQSAGRAAVGCDERLRLLFVAGLRGAASWTGAQPAARAERGIGTPYE